MANSWLDRVGRFLHGDDLPASPVVAPAPNDGGELVREYDAALRRAVELREQVEQARQDTRVQEQVSMTAFSVNPTQEDYYWGRIATGAEEDYFWRRLSDNWYQKDVIPSTYLEIHNQCYEAYNANPLANYIIEITTNFVLGNGVSVTSKNRKVQKVIDAFWEDPDNHMASRVFQLCTELSLYGEQFIRFFVNPYDGTVKIRQIDPSMIDQIETDPEDIEKVIRIHRRPQGPGQNVWSSNFGNVSATAINSTGPETAAPAANSYSAAFPVSSPSTTPDPTMGEWLAVPDQAIHCAINKVSNAKRGKSDLATLIPWLRRYRDWLTDRVRINKYKSAFLWTIKLTGADRKTIDRKRMEYSYPPDPGSIIVHNESEEWNAVQPQINADDVEADGRAIKMMVAMGAGLPEHYLSEGGNVNYATAAEMGLPTLRKFMRRQDEFVLMLRLILDRVVAEAVNVGRLSPTSDLTYQIHVPELAPDDNATLASATQSIANALSTARSQGWVSRETAMRMFFDSANLPDVDVNEEIARMEAELAAGVVPPAVPGSLRDESGGERQKRGDDAGDGDGDADDKGGEDRVHGA
jgi:hypothetical protein